MKRVMIAAFLAVTLAGFAGGQDKIILSAAASLTDVLSTLKPEAEKAVGAQLLINFGGSGALRKQIEQGAPVDVFFSAASEDMDKLEKERLLEPGTRHDLLSNAIVLVGDKSVMPPSDTAALQALLSGASLLAIGDPDAVPAGRYAVQALKTLGLYSIVEKKLVLGGTVREVLQYVESGSAPFGVVFLTDAMTLKPGSSAVKLFQFPQSALQTPVLYPIAVISSSKAKAKATLLVSFLQSSSARAAFTAAGFILR